MVQVPRRTSGTGLEIEMVVEREERAKAAKVVAEWRVETNHVAVFASIVHGVHIRH
jgi:hypothetical protein